MSDSEALTGKLSELTTALEQRDVKQPVTIPANFLSANGKLAKLINNEDKATFLLMRDEDYEITFDIPIYVHKVHVDLAEYDNVRGMKLTGADLVTGKPIKYSAEVTKVTGQSVAFLVNRTLTSIALNRGSYFSKKLAGIRITGIYPEDFDKFDAEFKELNETKNEILEIGNDLLDKIAQESSVLTKTRENTKAQLEALQADIELAVKEKEEIDTQLAAVAKALEETEADLNEKKFAYDQAVRAEVELGTRKLTLESELTQKSATLDNTNVSISQAEEKLKDLVNNVNVFSEEFSGFVDQGAKQARIYFLLAIIPLLLLCIVVFQLFYGAVDLSTRYEQMPNMALLTLMATRMPFVLVAALIVGVSIKAFFFLVNRIVAIHQQRLDFAKIAIIAKDVSDASSTGLPMSTDDVYEAKTYLKMNILKAYLSSQIDTFTYTQRTMKNDSSRTSSAKNDTESAAYAAEQAGTNPA